MLNGRGDEVIARVEQAEDGGVVALGAPGVENDLSVMAIEKLSQDRAGAINGLARLLPVQVDGRSVAEVLEPIGTHGLDHLRKQRGGGVCIHIHSAHIGNLLP
jgi:hypothetical protein